MIAGIPYVSRLKAERDVIPLVLANMAQIPAQKVIEGLNEPSTNSIAMAQRSGVRVVQGFITTYDEFDKLHPGLAHDYREDYLSAKAFVAKYAQLAEPAARPNREGAAPSR